MSTRTFRSRACMSLTEALRKLGGQVTENIYPGMGHTIVQDEIEHVQKILRGIGLPPKR